MLKLLSLALSAVVREGNITVVDSKGRSHQFGNGEGPPIKVEIADRRMEWHLALDPEMAAGEGYMQGRLRITQGNVYDFIAVMMDNWADRPFPVYAQLLAKLRTKLRKIAQFNPAKRSKRNVHHHYDIDPRIYDLFLDPDKQYSCAYFAEPDMSLAEAQAAKKRHIAAKLDIAPGHNVLDIGCGWGGMGLYLARATQAKVTGITLSEEQLKIARERAEAAPPEIRPRFEMQDYRALAGKFDRIVSVGMFEHVGLPHYGTFFKTVGSLLAPNGTALIHTIGRTDTPTATNPFIARYIFPGGYLPALSEMMVAIEASGLIVSDVEVLRLHYAETLLAWRRRFMANQHLAIAIAGEEFCRMWEFYLAGCEAAFRYQKIVVFQVQLTRKIDGLPITRDYIADAEHKLPLDQADPDRPQGIAAGRA